MTRAHRQGLRPPLLVLALLIPTLGCGAEQASSSRAGNGAETIGLYSSLPIAWNENEDIRGMLADETPPHWALTALRARGRVVPVDTLADGKGELLLPGASLLVLAQPRPLTPQENVALDAWVQRGGRVLLFADPMLTAHSRFSPGDPRRPQDIALLSPILARWGLAQEFDEGQDAGEHVVPLGEGDLPLNLPGRFRELGKSGGGSGMNGEGVATCRLEAGGLIADCAAGKGRILAIADAALLENPQEPGSVSLRKLVLGRLLDRLSAPAATQE